MGLDITLVETQDNLEIGAYTFKSPEQTCICDVTHMEGATSLSNAICF